MDVTGAGRRWYIEPTCLLCTVRTRKRSRKCSQKGADYRMDKHSTRKLIQYELRDVKNSKRVFFTRHISGLYLAADEKRAGAEYFV